MRPQIALFRFTLGAGQSISPAALRTIWIRASGSADVSVGRQIGMGSRDTHIYSLYATQKLGDLAAVESRLRRLFETSKLNVSLTALFANAGAVQ